jgi:SAM-dependent methyltransferase
MEPKTPADGADEIADPASQFDEIAFLYDRLMSGVPYGAWVAYLERILSRFECNPSTILDVCCGTGNVSLLLAKKGYRVSGVDISPSMIEIAREKSEKRCIQADFQVADVCRFNLGRRFNLAVSLFDSLNYILESALLQQAFHCISEHVEHGGLLIFDMNTEMALAGGMFDQSNLGSDAPVIYKWRSAYDSISRLCRIHMDYRYNQPGTDKHVDIVHYQRAYETKEIGEMLWCAGFDVLAIYDAYSFREASTRSDRIFFVARK